MSDLRLSRAYCDALYLLIGRAPADPAWSIHVYLSCPRDTAPSRRWHPLRPPPQLPPVELRR